MDPDTTSLRAGTAKPDEVRQDQRKRRSGCAGGSVNVLSGCERTPAETCAARYQGVVEESACLYVRHLHRQLQADAWSPAALRAGTALIETIERALAKREALQPAESTFTPELMRDVEASEAKPFVNEYTLGWGRDSAPVIVIGTEEAYEPSKQNLGLWNCSCSVIWLSGGRSDVIRQLLGFPEGNVRTDDLEPRCANIHYSDWAASPSAGQTWGCLAKVLVGSCEPDQWQACFKPSAPGSPPRTGLGDLCHQIEMSAYPAKNAAAGRHATEARIRFLGRLLTDARETATVLLFHGGAYAGTPRPALAEAFLGRAVSELPEVDHTPKRKIWRAEHDGRVVLHTNALNGRSTDNDYLMRVSAYIQESGRTLSPM